MHLRPLILALAAAFIVPQVAAQVLSPDGRLTVTPGADDISLEVRVIASGERLARIEGVPADAAIAVRWREDGRYVAVAIPRRKYTDLLVFAIEVQTKDSVDVVSVREVAYPPLPAGGIIERFPTSGKPAGTSLRLDSLEVTRFGWSPEGRLVAQAKINLVDDPSGDTSWRYVVDYSISTPTPPDEAGTLRVLNVVLGREQTRP